MAKKVKVALIYDFDGTLSTTDMQNYGLIPTFGMSCKTFWNKANTFGDQNMMEQITSSMYYVFKTAKDKKIPLTRELFFECGKNIQFFEGVENWFERINHYGDMLDLEIEHYVISAGYEEIIEGCAIRKYFKEVYGCAYAYDDKGEAVWPARVVNYSTKTQYLSKINKGLGKNDDVAVNEFTPDEERPIPFKRMIYFGDGMTDIPSMKLTKERGGNAIAVYDQSATSKQKALRLLVDNRVNFALHADYRENHELDQVVKTILDRIATERDLDILKAREEKKKQLLK